MEFSKFRNIVEKQFKVKESLRKKIEDAISRKEDDALEGKSIEELKKELENL